MGDRTFKVCDYSGDVLSIMQVNSVYCARQDDNSGTGLVRLSMDDRKRMRDFLTSTLQDPPNMLDGHGRKEVDRGRRVALEIFGLVCMSLAGLTVL